MQTFEAHDTPKQLAWALFVLFDKGVGVVATPHGVLPRDSQ